MMSAGFSPVGIAQHRTYTGRRPSPASVCGVDAPACRTPAPGPNRTAGPRGHPRSVYGDGMRFRLLAAQARLWPTNKRLRRNATGIGDPGNTAYQVPMHKTPPGDSADEAAKEMAPVIVTWADPAYLDWVPRRCRGVKAR